MSTTILSSLGKAGGLFLVTAIAEIAGCHLPYLWLRKGASPWLLVPAGLALALFAWLLTLLGNLSRAGMSWREMADIYRVAYRRLDSIRV